MRQRLIDGALLGGLVVVAFAIMWTLFTLGRGPTSSRPAPDPPPIEADRGRASTDAADEGSSDVVALEPGTAEPSGGSEGSGDLGAAGADAEGSEAADRGAGAASAASDGDGDAGRSADAEPAPLEPLPAGAVPLERVGFSYVTGGAGACGIVLEAWTHVAVSRDILAELPCGTRVTLRLDEAIDGRDAVEAVVGDTMNPSFARTVNIYVGEDEPALEYGITAGTLER